MDARPVQVERNRSLPARLCAGMWRLVMFCVFVACLAAGVVGAWLYVIYRVDCELSAHLEGVLARHYAERGLAASIGYVRLIEGKGIEIHDVVVSDPRAESPGALLVHIDKVFVVCDARMQDLINGPPDIEQIVVRGLKMRATRQADGSWNAQRLFPPPKFSDCAHVAMIENATFELVDTSNYPTSVFTLRDINLSVRPQTDEAGTQAAGAEPPIQIRGSLTGDHLQHMGVDCLIDPQHQSWTILGAVDELEISKQLQQSLPRELAEQLAPLAELRGRLKLNFQLTSPQGEQPNVGFVVAGRLTQGQFEDPRLPYPLSDMQAELYADNEGLKIENLAARAGLSKVKLSYHRVGWTDDSPQTMNGEVQQLAVDRRLSDSLPAELRSAWQNYWPSGVVNADLRMSFDGSRWTPDLSVECLDVSFAHYKFPYRLSGGAGSIHLKGDMLTVRMRALAAGQVVRIDGDFRNPGPDYTGGIDVVLDAPIPLDEKLLSAISGKAQQVIRSLQPRGMITFKGRFERNDPREDSFEQQMQITLHDCAIKYEKLPYPLERIRGTLEANNQLWTFRNLEGHNDSGYVTCEGSWTPAGDGRGGQLVLDYVGTDIALEDELRRALPENAQRMWSSLRPRGSIDHVRIGMRYNSAREKFDVDVRAQKWKQMQNVEGRTINIEPSWFPYRMENVTGAIHYHDGQIELVNVAAVHDEAEITLNGNCDFSADGRWRADFQRLTADRLAADHTLVGALPRGLGAAVAKLNLKGPVSVLGSLQLAGAEGKPFEASWDLSFDVEGGSVKFGLPLDNLRGGVRLTGRYDQRGLQSRGELAIDSLDFHKVQLTRVSGPVSIDGSRVVFGAWTNLDQSAAPARQITASAFGGTLSGEAQVSLAGDGEFFVQGSLSDCDLARVSHEAMPQQRDITGKAHAGIRLTGNSKGTHTLRGEGVVRLRNADIYEVPLMISLLKLLSIREPDKTAFTTSDIDFRVQGDVVYFDRIDFNGDAISLKGRGEMNLQRHLNMYFYTMVGRQNLHLPIVRPAMGLASRQLMLIHVAGTLDQPELERKAFPGLNDTLQQIFPESPRKDPLPTTLLPKPNAATHPNNMLPRR